MVALENGFDGGADFRIGTLGGGGPGSVVEAAARDLKRGADLANAVAGGVVDGPNPLLQTLGC